MSDNEHYPASEISERERPDPSEYMDPPPCEACGEDHDTWDHDDEKDWLDVSEKG